MAMVVKNNLSAVRTLNVLNSNSAALQKGMARVSSGMKITGAQDDAAGFAISERMRVRIRALDQANQNTQNDSSLMKTAEGAVGNTIDILKALKEKCINAANDSNTDEDRQTIQKEIDQYIDQIDDNALVTFNGKYLIDGSKNNAATATKTILLNQSLEEGTLAANKLTSLNNRAGDSLGIQSTDYYQVSWVENGKIHTTSGQVLDNSIADILSKPDVNGKKLQATVAATSSDGLIGTTEPENTLLKGYSEVGGNVFNVTTTTDTDAVVDMFKDDATLKKKVTDALATMVNPGDTFEINGYSTTTFDTDGNPTAAPTSTPITITFTDTTDGGTTTGQYYTVSAPAAAGATDADSGVALYKKTAPTETAAKSDGTPKPDETGYINAPTDMSLKLTATSYTVTLPGGTWDNSEGGSLATVLGITTSTAQTTTFKLGDYGIYTKDDDGNYTKVDATATYEYAGGAATTGTLTLTFGTPSAKDQDLYQLDLTQTAVTGTGITYVSTINGTATTDPATGAYYDIPSTITVVKDPDPNAPVEKEVPDKYNKDVYTPDKTYGVAVVAKEAGVNNQISGLTISILDQDHNVKKAANAALDQFKQYQRAENETGDKSLNFHIGSEANQAIKVGLTDMRAQALGLKGSDGTRINVFTKENANASINVIENALTKALDQQTTIGAVESRLEYTSTNLTTASENVQASESTIRDADMAKEMTNYTKANVLLQAAQAMLAQANQSSSSVLSLLQ